MIRGFYTGRAGMIAQQQSLDTIANNMSNANTTGFKAQLTALTSLLYEDVNGGNGSEINTGHGVKVMKNGLIFKQASLEPSESELDCGIEGKGFFTIQNPENGDIYYTRDGSFGISVEGDQNFLVDGSGYYVMDADLNRINITDGFSAEQLGIFYFDNPYGLELTGNNFFLETPQSGAPQLDTQSAVYQGMLESSGTDVGVETARMIEAQRSFQFSSRIVQTADEMEAVINQLR
ncbi:flagellar hook-basal body protein [Eubacteriaceae bacterium ES3]|nr:flagellar hook-basal body protein [Eubacteriaceae bacterium ES3]